MSLVMSIITPNYLLISGDKRMLDYNNNIVDENVRKIAVLNDNSFIGFAGSGKSCGGIIEYIQSIDLKKYCIDDICKIISTKSKELHKINNDISNVLVGGLNKKGSIVLNIISPLYNFANVKVELTKEELVSFVAFESGNSKYRPRQVFDMLWKEGQPSKEEALNILRNIHNTIAKDDYSVNTSIDYIYIGSDGKMEYLSSK
ncbi:hypothetical protein [Paraclostridium bifermentans]|uniref:hypothetical protein n=1 Tax=Paraclostridium bifermentans TaxID=1490 RepID=UPI000408F74C|nr:hypothetical protein [Paraclostridium bifermentans]